MDGSLFRVVVVAAVCSCSPLGTAAEFPFLELETPSLKGGTLDDVGTYSLNGELVAFALNSQLVAAIRGSQVFIWKVPTGELLWHQVLPRREQPRIIGDAEASLFEREISISFSPDGRRLAVASDYPTSIYIWELAAASAALDIGEPVVLAAQEFQKLIPKKESESSQAVQFKWWSDSELVIHMPGRLVSARVAGSPQIRLLLTSPAGFLFGVEPAGETERNINVLFHQPYRGVGIQAVVSRYRESRGRVENLTSPRFTKLMQLTASPNWQRFAGVDLSSQSLGIFDATSGVTQPLGDASVRWSARMAWSADGKLLATASDMREDSLVLWEVDRSKRVAEIELPILLGQLEVGAFSPSDRYLMTADGPNTRNSGTFQLWDVETLRSKYATKD